PLNRVRARFVQAPQLKPGWPWWGPHLMHQWFRQAERRGWYTRPCTQLRTVPPNLQKVVPGQAASIRTSRRFQLSEELELSQQSSLSERCNQGLIYRVGKRSTMCRERRSYPHRRRHEEQGEKYLA